MAAIAVIRLPRPGTALLTPAATSSTSLRRRGARARVGRLSVVCRAGGDGEQEEDSPESLFARELLRRGMAPGAAPSAEAAAGEKQAEEGGAEAGRKRGVAAAAAGFERGAAAGGGGADGQRERSMALNSEGLEGLIPRAKLLLSLGGTFFLAFGPLILVTVSLFAGLYLYFGPSFVHDASKTPISPPPYIDPYGFWKTRG
ncbi:hypothetical protein EJB05_27223, partial [Eragrostis curvula]